MWCVCDKKFFGDEIKFFYFYHEEKGDGLIFTMLLKFSLFYLSSPKTTRHTRFAVFSISMTSIILSIVIVSRRRRRIIIRRRMRPRRGVVVVLPSFRETSSLARRICCFYRRTTRFEDRAFVLSSCRARPFPLEMG